MENTSFEQRIVYHQAKSELISRLRTIGIITLLWFALLRICLLGSEDPSNWELLLDALTTALGFYLPYRVGYTLTGKAIGGTIGALVILIWMSTWVTDHEFLSWVVIIIGYLLDFAPCVYRLISSRHP